MMEGRRFLNHLIIVVSTAIFLYQSGTAFFKLNAKQTIFISEVIDINDPRVSQPLITVCMTNQIPSEKDIKDSIYFTASTLFLLYKLHDFSDDTFSFGKHLNLTYWQLIKKYSKPKNNFLQFHQNQFMDGNELSDPQMAIPIRYNC